MLQTYQQNDTKVNVQHSPSLREGNKKRTIVKKMKRDANYERHLAETSSYEIDMVDFAHRYSLERKLEYDNRRNSEVSKTPERSNKSNTKKLTRRPKSSIQKIAPKSTGAKKGCNESKECQNSNNTVVEISPTIHKSNHGNFKQIKRPDIDKHSMQKSL
ncbi:hypothetical protein TNCV_2425581 [Trichonephila clavipes]|nr:hypothetical protein TNCV_2425581 [Trichonephila clavipes]